MVVLFWAKHNLFKSQTLYSDFDHMYLNFPSKSVYQITLKQHIFKYAKSEMILDNLKWINFRFS